MKQKKVFGIGFHRTGTTSLQTALEALDYNVTGMRDEDWADYVAGDYDSIKRTIATFDGFRDMPWPLMYKWLHETYPDAVFVLTYRGSESWARSCAGNYKTRPYAMFPEIYGFDSFAGNEETAIAVYEKHIADVRAYFADHPAQFLEVDVTSGLSWDVLCDFLGEPLPDRPFPHANKRPKSIFKKVYWRLLRTLAPAYYRRVVRDKV